MKNAPASHSFSVQNQYGPFSNHFGSNHFGSTCSGVFQGSERIGSTGPLWQRRLLSLPIWQAYRAIGQNAKQQNGTYKVWNWFAIHPSLGQTHGKWWIGSNISPRWTTVAATKGIGDHGWDCQPFARWRPTSTDSVPMLKLSLPNMERSRWQWNNA